MTNRGSIRRRGARLTFLLVVIVAAFASWKFCHGMVGSIIVTP